MIDNIAEEFIAGWESTQSTSLKLERIFTITTHQIQCALREIVPEDRREAHRRLLVDGEIRLVKTPDGVRLAPRAMSEAAQIAEYDKAHAACPKCFNTDVQTTLLSWHLPKNHNRIQCQCGWRGIAHELLPRVTGSEATQ
jgi:hypothetical protein